MIASSINRRKIAVRLDDAGAFPCFTAGCVEAARAGVAKCVSVMVPPSPFHSAAGELASLAPDVEIGLHVTLNCEWPGVRWKSCAHPDAVPDLVDNDGYFRFQAPSEINQVRVPLNQMLHEVRAQLATIRASGLRPTYLDEHMGVGWVGENSLRKALIVLCEEEGLIHADTLPKTDSFDSPTHPEGAVFIFHPSQADFPHEDIGHSGLPQDVIQSREAELRLLISSASSFEAIGMREASRLARM